jgi:DNA primase
MLYDGDIAGIKASFRAIDMLLAEGLDVRVALFPDNEDPDSYSRKYSAQALIDFLKNNKKSFVIFKAEVLFEEAGSDTLKKATAIKDIVQSIAEIPDAISRSLLISECSKLFNLQEKTLIFELNKILNKKVKKEQPEYDFVNEEVDEDTHSQKNVFTTTNRQEDAEKNLIRIILQFGNKTLSFKNKDEKINFEEIIEKSVAEYIFEELEADNMKVITPELSSLYDICKTQFETNGQVNYNTVFNLLNPEQANIVANLLNTQYSLSPNWEKRHGIFISHAGNDNSTLVNFVDHAILEFKHLIINKEMEKIRKKLQEPMSEEDSIILVHQYQILKTIDIEIEKRVRKRVINK